MERCFKKITDIQKLLIKDAESMRTTGEFVNLVPYILEFIITHKINMRNQHRLISL